MDTNEFNGSFVRGLEFNSQHQHSSSKPVVTPVPVSDTLF